ncbi:MAG: hypothetical protein U0869_24540 [Chloroflexota bacterium]
MPPDVMIGGGTATMHRSESRTRAGAPVRGTDSAPMDVALAFALAWMADDLSDLERRSAADLECRWIGFEPEPLVAHGLPDALRVGRRFEERHGKASRYSVADSLVGARHAAILFEVDELPPGQVSGVRMAIYRVEDARVTSIEVYADRLDRLRD